MWVAAIREVAPEAALYLEAVFSIPLAQGVLAGDLDLGIVFTQSPHPDLHFEPVGELPYALVSSAPATLDTLDLATYILPDYSPAFLRFHREHLPELSLGLTTVGQSDLALAMMRRMGGTSYQPRSMLAELQAEGFHLVDGAPLLSQPVFAVVHLRNRHRKLHKQVMRAMAAAM